MQVILDANIDAINMLRGDTIRVLEHTSRIALPEPVNENPELDPPDIIVDEDIPEELGNDKNSLKLRPEFLSDAFTVQCPAMADRKIKVRPITDCDKCESKSNCEAWGI